MQPAASAVTGRPQGRALARHDRSPDAFAGLQDRIAPALVALEGIDFTAEEFLRSVSRPNRDFHARAVASEIITLHTRRIAPARA